MNGRQELFNNHTGRWEQWTDVRDAQTEAFIQDNYGLYAPSMFEAAMRISFYAHRENPLVKMLDSLQWDGKPRLERFLTDVMKADDSDYMRECSRLIFSGGVHRAYKPGCKFDEMIVLTGKQGVGKGTICRWLNMDESFYRTIKTIQGKEAVEGLRGAWIAEMEELMATRKAKEVEIIKSFISNQEDSYRAPYNKHVEVIPRRCIFIGTANEPQFLTDKTGNRRFYPVNCNSDINDIQANEKQIKELIRQCWAEAVARYKKGEMQPYANTKLLGIIRRAQDDAMEDDWRIGAIEQYLDDTKKGDRDTVCVIELWHQALQEPAEKKPTRSDSIEIGKIMNSFKDWERAGTPVRTQAWGVQKAWRKRRSQFPF